MKTRILSFLLALSLLLSALPLSFAAEETAEKGEFVITPLEFPLEQTDYKERSPEDEIGSVSRIKASPSMKSQAVELGDWMKLTFFLYDSGTPDTYFTVKIYKGSSASGTPVVDSYGQFPGERGFYSADLSWEAIAAKSGPFLVVMESAKMSGGKLVPISGTRSTEKVYGVGEDIPVTKLTAVDMDSRKEVKKLALPTDRVTYLEFVMTPAKNTHSRYFDVREEGGAVAVDTVGGLLVLAPKAFGWSTITVISSHPNTHEPLIIDVEICVNEAGHVNQKTVTIAPAEKTLEGVILHYCPDCGSNYLEYTDNCETVFAKLTDVPQSEWYYRNVKAAVEGGLFNGVSKHNFNPADSMTRAMLVTVLWRYAGQPEAGRSAFTDVPEGQWYTQAVTWAAEQGIVGGVGNGRFDPDGKVTREQMAAILHRYAKQNGLDTEAPSDVLQNFSDLSKVSSYALEPLQWAVHQGIIGGTQEGGLLLLDPQGSATRAQVAAILTRFIDKFYPVSFPVPDKESAEESGNYEGLDWAFYPDGTLMVGGTEAMPGYNRGYYSIEWPWAHLKDRISKVVILDGVQNIGQDAFRECKNLKEVVLPNSMRYIELDVFAYCTSLEKIEIPKGTRFLGDGVLKGCAALKDVSLPDTIYLQGDGTHGDYDARNLFNGCSSLESVTLPIGMQRIPFGMFAGCTNLKEVNFGPGQTAIAQDAFGRCTSLETLVLPLSVNCVVDEAFVGCTNLKDLVFLNPMARVQYVFYGEYNQPFGIRGTTTVYAYSFTHVAEVAQAEGYDFVALDE